MIVLNEVNAQGGSENKTDNRTFSHKHRTGRILVQAKQWCLYDYSIPDSRGETHVTILCS